MSCCKDKKYYTELCDNCKREMTTFEASDYPHYTDYPTEEWFVAIVETKCECGSDKTGGPGHSSWCPKHIKRDENEV